MHFQRLKRRNSASGRWKAAEKIPLSDEIVRQLTTLISEGKLKPGDRLPSERELCKKLAVGRTSLREALKTLSILGVLDVRVGEGTFVAPDVDRFIGTTLEWGILTDPKDFRDLMEARLTLESQIAPLAAQRITDEELEDLREMVERMRAMGRSDMPAYSKLDIAFHLKIAEASRNAILQRLLGMIRALVQEWISRTLSLPDTSQLALRDHLAVVEALERRDPEAARQAMQTHITNMIHLYWAHFDGASPQRPESSLLRSEVREGG